MTSLPPSGPASDSGPESPSDHLLTLAGPAEAELKEKRSRFLAFARPITDEADADAVIDEIARRYHDARHVCTGWRLGLPPHTAENRNDDGEPAGTAGEPILAAIRRLELVDVLVVVVRYFGGIKLGTGGLARAYGGAADEALAAAPIRRVLLGREFRLEFQYPQQKTIRRQVDLCGGRLLEETYAADVVWRVWLPHSACDRFLDSIRELTAGRVVPEPLTEQTRL